MKKTTLVILAVLAGFSLNAQNARVLSHSADQVPTEGAVACNASDASGSEQNIYWRSYTPSDFGESGTILLTGGEVGVAFFDQGGNDPTFDITLNAFTTDSVFPDGNLTEIASATITISVDNHLEVVPFTFDIPVEISASEEVVINMDNPQGIPSMVITSISQNASGETAPTYISTVTGCGPIGITSFDDLGFPGNGVLNIVVDDLLSVNDKTLAENFSIFPNPTNGAINISASRNFGLLDVTITNIAGQTVLTSTIEGVRSTLNTTALSSGIYFAQINTEEGSTVMKFIKN
jgi:hypothetical protein